MPKETNNKLLSGEGNYRKSYRFTDPSDLHQKYVDIKGHASKEKSIQDDNLMKAYDKKPLKNSRTGKLEPNHGQFSMRVDKVVETFMDYITESPERFKVNCMFQPEMEKQKFARLISSHFSDIFFKSWEDMLAEEAKAIFDMVMFSKGLMYWPEKVGYKSECVSTSCVFPDINAKMNPKTWNLLFIKKEITLIELYDIAYGEDDSDIKKGWDKEAITRLLTNPVTDSSSETYLEQFNSGKAKQLVQDFTVTILDCYVKEYKEDKEGMRISKYVILESGDFHGLNSKKTENPGYLFKDNANRKCISQVMANRATSVTRSYWSSPSFAEKIYLSCKLYDQSTNAIIRAVIRNMTLFLKTKGGGDDEIVDKLRNLGNSEVEMLPEDLELVQNQIRIPIQEAMTMVRQITFDVDSNLPSGQAIGSQNTKGYAITAKEAEIRSSNESNAESVMIKMFCSLDRFFYKETYRRALEAPSTEEKRLQTLFKRRMEYYNVPSEAYKPEDVVIEPVFSYGGSRSNKIQFAQSLYTAVSINASSDAQKSAKKQIVAAHVGESNVDEYFNQVQDEKNLLEVQQKAGSENEDMDNPNLNPQNVPVAKDDNHNLELVFHIQDYEFKLNVAMKMIEQALQYPSVMKITFLVTALDIIKAQDTKGAHIEAHFQYLNQDPTVNEESTKQIYAKFSELRKSQDELQVKAQAEVDNYLKENEQDAGLTIEQQHKKAMYAMEEEHQKTLNEIGLSKAVEQHEMGKERAATKVAQDFAQKEQLGNQKVSQKQRELDIEIAKKATKELQ